MLVAVNDHNPSTHDTEAEDVPIFLCKLNTKSTLVFMFSTELKYSSNLLSEDEKKHLTLVYFEERLLQPGIKTLREVARSFSSLSLWPNKQYIISYVWGKIYSRQHHSLQTHIWCWGLTECHQYPANFIYLKSGYFISYVSASPVPPGGSTYSIS